MKTIHNKKHHIVKKRVKGRIFDIKINVAISINLQLKNTWNYEKYKVQYQKYEM